MKGQENYKAICSGYYDLQKMRIQAGNRIVANFKIRIGQDTSQPESSLDKEGQEILARIRSQYKLIADAAAKLPDFGKFKGNEVISTYAELVLIDAYENMADQEERYLKRIRSIIQQEPFWKEWMADVKGLGELMALCIFAKIDITKARHPSSLWKYCGLDVAEDGKGRSKRTEHLQEKEYVTRAGDMDTKMSITYNPWLKTKILGVLGPSFIKAGDNKYSQIYRDYKARLENHDKYGEEKKPGHRHYMALRYMMKMFLIDLHCAWRKFEGLPPSRPYHEAKLGIIHGEDGQAPAKTA